MTAHAEQQRDKLWLVLLMILCTTSSQVLQLAALAAETTACYIGYPLPLDSCLAHGLVYQRT
jgi:hypothetical protein